MSRRPIVAVALAGLLATSGVLLLEPAALAGTGNRHPASAAQKNDKNKKQPVRVKLATTPLGKILVTTKGFTLYAFDPDGTDTVSSKCVDACTKVWPAYVASKKTKGVGKGLDKSLLGVGGGGQVVYNDHLLYRFADDTAVGQTNGQGIANIWHVVGADGNPIT